MLVSLDLVKKHCVLDSYDGDDDLLTHYVEAAEEHVITLTNCSLEELKQRSADGVSLPKPLQQAVMMLAAQWYDQREANSRSKFEFVPDGVHALIMPYRKLVEDSE